MKLSEEKIRGAHNLMEGEKWVIAGSHFYFF
jgi:hypothetical protein